MVWAQCVPATIVHNQRREEMIGHATREIVLLDQERSCRRPMVFEEGNSIRPAIAVQQAAGQVLRIRDRATYLRRSPPNVL